MHTSDRRGKGDIDGPTSAESMSATSHTACSRHESRSRNSTSADSRETCATSSETKVDVRRDGAAGCQKGKPGSAGRLVAPSYSAVRQANALTSS
jgi:hypothetical protein